MAGSGLLIATAAIHLDLYLTGYRTIPTIGWLFLLQVIAAFGLGLAVLAIPRPARHRRPAGRRGRAGFALATLGGYLAVGLDRAVRVHGGPHDRRHRRRRRRGGRLRGPGRARTCSRRRRTARRAARQAASAAIPGPDPPGGRPGGRSDRRGPGGCGAGAARSRGGRGQLARGTRGQPGAGLKTATIGGTTVLTNAKGFTLYSFAPDTPASSKCYGSCAAYWPPVTGTTAAGQGLPGKVATITRTGGSRQLTYNGHPLYTYIGDTAPGQARGNNLNLNGGLWHEVPASR